MVNMAFIEIYVNKVSLSFYSMTRLVQIKMLAAGCFTLAYSALAAGATWKATVICTHRLHVPIILQVDRRIWYLTINALRGCTRMVFMHEEMVGPKYWPLCGCFWNNLLHTCCKYTDLL